MKRKIMPILVVLLLILIVTGVGAGTFLVRRYAPSKERVEPEAYFGVNGTEEAALIVNRELVEEKVKKIDGRYYLANSVVGKYVNNKFYWDEKQKVMIYTLPTEAFQIVPDTTKYQTSEGTQHTDYVILRSEGENYYLDLEFVKAYTDMEYTVYENPNRVVIQTDFSGAQMVTVNQKTVIRQKGGIKSAILTDAEAGDQLYLAEEMDDWSEVVTQDGYRGYVEKADIGSAEAVTPEHVGYTVDYTSVRRDYKINMAWHQVTSQEGNAALQSVLADTQGLNTISPTWYSVIDDAGTLSSLASADYVNQAHALGLEVWALIDNFSENADTLTFLSDSTARANIIAQLMQEADTYGLDGINLDFEMITEDGAPHYIQFIRELSIACRNRGLVFSIDDPVPMPYTMHYDRKTQGEVADYVIIMGYDEHHSSDTEAGSVASLGFVRDGIENTLKEVPAEKVIHAIPFYTRLWIESYGGGLTNEAMGMDTAANYIAEHNMEVYWDDTCGQNVATLEGEDAIYTIWVEDEQSIGEKMKLVQEHQLAGVAEWKLGFERASVWSVIGQYLQ